MFRLDLDVQTNNRQYNDPTITSPTKISRSFKSILNSIQPPKSEKKKVDTRKIRTFPATIIHLHPLHLRLRNSFISPIPPLLGAEIEESAVPIENELRAVCGAGFEEKDGGGREGVGEGGC